MTYGGGGLKAPTVIEEEYQDFICQTTLKQKLEPRNISSKGFSDEFLHFAHSSILGMRTAFDNEPQSKFYNWVSVSPSSENVGVRFYNDNGKMSIKIYYYKCAEEVKVGTVGVIHSCGEYKHVKIVQLNNKELETLKTTKALSAVYLEKEGQ